MRQAIGPFDGQHAVCHAQLLQSEIARRGTIEAIQVDVIQRQSTASVLMDEREGRAAHFPGIDAKSMGKSANECRFARPKVT